MIDCKLYFEIFGEIRERRHYTRLGMGGQQEGIRSESQSPIFWLSMIAVCGHFNYSANCAALNTANCIRPDKGNAKRHRVITRRRPYVITEKNWR